MSSNEVPSIKEIIGLFRENKEMVISIVGIISLFLIVYGSYNLGKIKMCSDSGGIYAEDGKCYFPQYDPHIRVEDGKIIIDRSFNASLSWVLKDFKNS